MKTIQKRMIYFACIIVIGILFMVIGKQDTLFFVGAGFIGTGIVRLIQYYRIYRDEARLKQYELIQKEERLIYIANRSGSIAFYCTILIQFIAIVGFSIAGQENVSTILSYVICIQTLLYLAVYRALNKKY